MLLHSLLFLRFHDISHLVRLLHAGVEGSVGPVRRERAVEALAGGLDHGLGLPDRRPDLLVEGLLLLLGEGGKSIIPAVGAFFLIVGLSFGVLERYACIRLRTFSQELIQGLLHRLLYRLLACVLVLETVHLLREPDALVAIPE